MRIAVIGAGRRKNGIGAYIARFAHEAGANVAAVLSHDLQAACEDAEALRQLGIAAEPYDDLAQLLRRVRPDALVVASPASTHGGYLEAAIGAGVHVFCEKPFVWNNGCDCASAERLLDSAECRGLVVAMNSQWPFVLPAYARLCPLPPADSIHSFRVELSPVSSGCDMIPDSMPHALSLLYSVLGPGRLEDIVLRPGPGSLEVTCDYVTPASRCRVEACLTRCPDQPRPFAFGFNGMLARREIDLQTYTLAFSCGGRSIAVDDPLRLSVHDFLRACRDGAKPAIGRKHILETSRMLQQVYACWPVPSRERETDGGETSQQGA